VFAWYEDYNRCCLFLGNWEITGSGRRLEGAVLEREP
jgi:hypothetical protein